jgi:hypothetical protein
MALKTEKGLILPEQIIGYGPVGIMANGAIFNNRCMFIDKRALLVCMAVETQVVRPFGCLQVFNQ